MRRYLAYLSLLLLTGCGYKMGQGELPCKYRTVCVPFVAGDKTGEMTTLLVEEISKSSPFRYDSRSGELVLEVAIIDIFEENIGFRHDRNKRGKIIDSIIPTETRITILAEVIARESCSGCVVLGPARINASVDFDHDYYYSRHAVNIFSLGQVTDIDEARDAVKAPLYRVLAEKIVDYLANSW